MLADLLSLATAAAHAAGAELARRYGAASGVAYKTSSTDPVSDADREAERVLVDMLREARPDDGVLGEEGAQRSSRTGLRWILDPLDGTVNYLYGLPAWAVSVACEDDAGVLLGVVHDPLRDETFTATRGGGAFLGGLRLRVNDPVSLERALVATGFAYAPDDRARQGAIVGQLIPRVRDVRRVGACALDLCWTAAGRVDGYYEDTTQRWDWAAGALIVTEAGGVVTPFGAGLIAAGPMLHRRLVQALSSTFPGQDSSAGSSTQ